MVDAWYQNAVFYEVYVRAFCDSNGDGQGDLAGVTDRLDYLKELGVDCVWLLPIYESPLLDDGYDISDYYRILKEYGTVDDVRRLVDAAHARHMRVIADLVLNHTSDQHPWFQSARAARDSAQRDYYVWSDTDQKYRGTRIIFVDTEKSNWAWDPVAGQYYWHRFYSCQPDLNYDSPAVRAEILKVIQYWLDLGLDGFRADAVPYLFEREGTNCENLPETHAYLKEVRRFIDQRYPGRILLAEANQWPQDLIPYFGEGDEFQMAFHFPVMPRMFMAMRRGDVEPIVRILQATPSIPAGCQWGTFLRNHDELTLEMVTPQERDWMWREYAPDPRMRLNLGIRRRLAPLLDHDRRKIQLMFALLFSLPGSPILYYGDEIGMGDNIALKDRDGVRTPMQWTNEPNAGFSKASPGALYSGPIAEGPSRYQEVNVAAQRADPNSLWHMVRKLILVRKAHSAFGKGSCEFLESGNHAVLAMVRRDATESILTVHNLSGSTQRVQLNLSVRHNAGWRDLIANRIFSMAGPTAEISLQPYEYLWIEIR